MHFWETSINIVIKQRKVWWKVVLSGRSFWHCLWNCFRTGEHSVKSVLQLAHLIPETMIHFHQKPMLFNQVRAVLKTCAWISIKLHLENLQNQMQINFLFFFSIPKGPRNHEFNHTNVHTIDSTVCDLLEKGMYKKSGDYVYPPLLWNWYGFISFVANIYNKSYHWPQTRTMFEPFLMDQKHWHDPQIGTTHNMSYTTLFRIAHPAVLPDL